MDNKAYLPPRDLSLIERMKSELRELDNEPVEIDGRRLKPSQCYRMEMDPVHIMFNTNCPGTLKERIESILAKYLKTDEGRSSQ